MLRFHRICSDSLLSANRRLSTTDDRRILTLSKLTVIPGSKPKRIRVGRGVGSGRGKTSAHGHQFSRATPRGFEGGQSTYWHRMPKSGFTNPNERDMSYLNLGKIQEFIERGRLITPGFCNNNTINGTITNNTTTATASSSDSNNNNNNKPVMITMRDLIASGLVSRVKEGVKLLADGKQSFSHPLHLEVSMASDEAIQAVEKAGGTVTCTYFTKLSLRALLNPYKYNILPLRARPVPKIMGYYLDKSKCGYLSPEIQMRNLKLFGEVTSEERYRREHEIWMVAMREERKLLKAEAERSSDHANNKKKIEGDSKATASV